MSRRRSLQAIPELLVGRAAPIVANGGTIRVADQPAGPYRVTVMTSPTPMRVGTTDLSVVATVGVGEQVPDATVIVRAVRQGDSAPTITVPATHDLATNKAFYAANVDVTAAGRWTFFVDVRGKEGQGSVQFSADVLPSVLSMSPFQLGCLGIIVALVAAVVVTVERSRRSVRRLDHRAQE